MIHVDALSKSFSVHRKDPGFFGSVRSLFKREVIEKHAVRSISFNVGEGEIVGLIGANGAGKTTLVKMLAGIIHPSGGNATVLGHQPWKRENAFRRQIALIMGQKAQLWWDLPAADCFLLLKEIYQLSDTDYKTTLDRLVSVLGVEQQMNIQIRRLSLGERMKMELIAALLHSPRVVYLDEPTIGLDIGAQRAIREFILDYQAKKQPAMLLTSHYMEDIERLCRRIIIVREGELVYDGGLQEVVQKYAGYKVLTARLGEGTRGTDEDLRAIGMPIENTQDTVKLHVPRERVAAAVGMLAAKFPVHDLDIQEEDIGTIINKIMTDRSGGAV